MDYTSWIIAGATIALVGVTIFYAIQTREMVKAQMRSVDAMKNSTEAQMKSVDAIRESTQAQFRPYINIDFSFRETAIPLILVSNVGKGAAISIEIRYKIKEIDTEEKLNIIPRLDKGDIKRIFLDSEGNKKNHTTNWYRDNQTILSVKWKCEDILKQI